MIPLLSFLWACPGYTSAREDLVRELSMAELPSEVVKELPEHAFPLSATVRVKVAVFIEKQQHIVRGNG